MYRFATRPRWLVLHATLLVVTALFALAGFWQLHRLAERDARNRAMRAAFTMTPVDLNRTVPGGRRRPVRVVAAGRFDTSHEVVLLGRSLGGRPGNHVLTPLVLRRGHAVMVDRGWVPAELGSPPVGPAAPGAVAVRVEGLLLPPEPKRPLSPDDPATGRLRTVSRINPPRLERQLPYRLVTDGYVMLERQSPRSAAELPVRVGRPELTRGPHLGYAIQWFSFIVVAFAGYAAVLRREARKRTRLVASGR